MLLDRQNVVFNAVSEFSKNIAENVSLKPVFVSFFCILHFYVTHEKDRKITACLGRKTALLYRHYRELPVGLV